MVKAYQTIGWKNYPSTDTPLNETNLLKIDNGLNTVDNRVISLDTTKLDLATANTMVKNITYNEANGVFTVTYLNGTTATLDTKLEKLAVNFEYDPTTEQLIVTLSDGTKQYVDLKSLITEYNFENSSEIAFTVTEGKVSAGIVNGSVTESKLQPNFLADCRSAKTDAETASTSASSKALVSEGYALGTQNGVAVTEGEYYHNNSKYFKEQAAEIVGGNYVPTSRKINGKELTSDITLSANDIGFTSEQLESTNVKDALEELKENIDGITFITWGDDALEDDVSELESGTMYCQMEDGNIKKTWIGIDDVAKPFSAGSPTPSTVDVTFTVEGAKEDNITIKDADGTVVGNVIFDTDATYKEVTLTISEEGGDYTFESSVAKATDGSGSNYTKVVHLPLSASDLGDCALVPIMTSNTTPSGVAFSKSVYQSGYEAYKAFDGNGGMAHSTTGDSNGWYCGYKFDAKVNVSSVSFNYIPIRIWKYKVQSSNDGNAWIDIITVQLAESTSETRQTTSISFDTVNAQYFRVVCLDNYYIRNSSSIGWVDFSYMQFYTKAVKIMPNNALYWYGNECVELSGGWGVDGYSWTNSSVTLVAPTKATNSINIPLSDTSGRLRLLGTRNAFNFNNFSKIKAITQNSISNTACIEWYTSKSGFAPTNYVYIPSSSTQSVSEHNASPKNNMYIAFVDGSSKSGYAYVYALWLE